ncbi:ATP-dependent DNA helicase [Hippea maritima]|uniref:DNA 5'-3' helicase n=1 Tax=Hippea maritima (strain ATCC 700847 / DSM 10411 / MH2) TaxID=760142 RepID=F2LXY3_HIPMA|nr:ATP-dependent DNA helicase [Hippea maritima]AEA33248.1 DEAD/DEAH box helicase domain protein [Hippea maritima DSM 10411]
MRISPKSLDLLKKAGPSSLFKVRFNSEIIEIISNANSPSGDLLMVCEDRFEAVKFVATHSLSVGWFFWFNPLDSSLEAIAKPKIDIDGIFESLFSRDGFEERKEQKQIAKIIFDSLKKSKNAIIEAPTGTGKSLAYLVACVIFSKQKGERVVISTNTINLQHQLVERDIPLLQEIVEFRAVLALGRSNYICKRRVEDILTKGNVFLFENDLYKKIKEFLLNTKTGLKSEFFSIYENVPEDVWRNVESSTLLCAHSKCPYYKNSCFFYKARAELEKADVIVANHHLVLSDSILESARILPDAYAVIFDEAHNIERNATNYYTISVSSDDILRSIDALYTKRKSKAYGLLSNVEGYKNLKELLVNFRVELESTFDGLIQQFVAEQLNIDDSNIKLIYKPVSKILELLNSIILNLKGFLDENKDKDFVDIRGVTSFLSGCADNLGTFLKLNDGFVCWIKRFKKTMHFNITPLDVRSALKGHLYDKLASVIFISATLSVGGELEFFKRSVGVDNAVEFIAESNFDYDKLARLLVVEDVKEPTQKGFDEDAADVILSIAESLKNTNKGVLVLFTSYAMLSSIYKRVYTELKQKGFNTFRQGELDNFELLIRFKKGKGFLFATSSFWEGIDVKGEQLSVVVMVRLPFEVPTTPIEKTRYELLKKQGYNAFLEYALPKAVLKFKQGLGRLIRKADDYGVMVVLDSRLINKSYGRIFLNSVSYIKSKRVRKNEIKDFISDFFANFAL